MKFGCSTAPKCLTSSQLVTVVETLRRNHRAVEPEQLVLQFRPNAAWPSLRSPFTASIAISVAFVEL